MATKEYMRKYNASERGHKRNQRHSAKPKRKTYMAERMRDFRGTKAGRLYQQDQDLKKRYGITLEQFNEILKSQSGKCAICNGSQTRKKSKRLDVDHDHNTGKVRGLLCNKCNSALGLLNHNPALLVKAIKYLEIYGIR